MVRGKTLTSHSELKASPRVISLVPSWTETLIQAGVNVVGRTQFCVHPGERCKAITDVGGIKGVDWQKIEALDPDLLILDRGENAKGIVEEAQVPCVITHVESVANVADELTRLAAALGSIELKRLADRWRKILERTPLSSSLDALPGVIEWIREAPPECQQLLYIIWRNPWMAVSKDTFIGSVLEALGYGEFLLSFDVQYPQITLEDFDSSRTLLLFATEPYPFDRDLRIARETGFPAALVDGELFSWFGVRSLRLLETQQRLSVSGASTGRQGA